MMHPEPESCPDVQSLPRGESAVGWRNTSMYRYSRGHTIDEYDFYPDKSYGVRPASVIIDIVAADDLGSGRHRGGARE